jgi:hypothetical protein
MRFGKTGLLAAAVVGVLACATAARASSIYAYLTADNAVADSFGNFSYTYTLSLDSTSKMSVGDYVTIYDIGGLVPVGAANDAPVWTANLGLLSTISLTSQLTGVAVSGLAPTDSGSILNITLTNTGGSDITSGQETNPVALASVTLVNGGIINGPLPVLGTLKVWSNLAPSTLKNIDVTSIDHADATNGATQKTLSSTQAPSPVPVPVSALMGMSTLLGAGVLRLFRKRSSRA